MKYRYSNINLFGFFDYFTNFFSMLIITTYRILTELIKKKGDELICLVHHSQIISEYTESKDKLFCQDNDLRLP